VSERDSANETRIAVIGGGIAGLTSAYLLSRRHRVTLFEAADTVGGHAHTIEVDDPDGRIALDTGFLVFNPVHYPRFTRLLGDLGIASQPTDMSFSVRDDHDRIEWTGTRSLNRVFGQRRNLVRPRFWRMLADIVRFTREAPQVIADPNDDRSVVQFAADHGYGHSFVEHYLLPMGASLWSCPQRRFGDFPIRFVAEFMQHHDLLRIGRRPTWHTITGGSRHYVDALQGRIAGTVELGRPVLGIQRSRDGVVVETADEQRAFDEAVCAVHADDALALLGDDADAEEREVLGAFPYATNDAVVHDDVRVLPRRPRCWAAWNHRRGSDADAPVSVTYYLNRLQRLSARRHWCVTLNPDDHVDASRIIARIPYRHPLFTTARDGAQAHHGALIRRRGLSYCGAYWGFGFHEDGVRSACAVAAAFGETL